MSVMVRLYKENFRNHHTTEVRKYQIWRLNYGQ